MPREVSASGASPLTGTAARPGTSLAVAEEEKPTMENPKSSPGKLRKKGPKSKKIANHTLPRSAPTSKSNEMEKDGKKLDEKEPKKGKMSVEEMLAEPLKEQSEKGSEIKYQDNKVHSVLE